MAWDILIMWIRYGDYREQIKRVPVTWDWLIRGLREVGLHSLADEVEEITGNCMLFMLGIVFP